MRPILLAVVVTAVAAAFPALAHADYRHTVLATNPAAYWTLDDGTSTALDISGHGHNGTYQPPNYGVSATQGADGAPITAPGNAGYMITGNVSPLSGGADPGGRVSVDTGAWSGWGGRGPFAVNLWVKWGGYNQWCYVYCSDLTQGIVGNLNIADSFGGWALDIPGATAAAGDGHIEFVHEPNTTTGTLVGPSLPKDAWTMVTATYDGTTMRLYVNGGLAASQDDTSDNGGGSGAFTIGALDFNRFFSGYWGNFKGTIDEVTYWNRALPDSEVSKIYAAQNAPPSPKPIVYFVPGVLGSELIDGNDTSGLVPPPWPNAVLIHAEIPFLAVQPDGVTSINYVLPDKVLGEALGKPVYGALLQNLTSMEAAGEISEFDPWPYDWRLGVDKAATQLADTLLGRCRTAHVPIWLIGHSTGGLIVKAALRMMRERGGIYTPETCLDGGGVVFLATPHDGAPKAIGSLINPDYFFDDPVAQWINDGPAMAGVANNWLTAWDLMPPRTGSHDPLAADEAWFDDHTDGLGDVNVNGDPLNWALADKASLDAPYAYDYAQTVGSLPVYNVFSASKAAPGSYAPGRCTLDANGQRTYVDKLNNVHLQNWVFGDGTVPAWSSIWPGSGIADQSQYSISGPDHVGIARSPEVADLLRQIIVDGDSYPDVAGLVHGAAAAAESNRLNSLSFRVDTCSPVAAIADYGGNEIGAQPDGTLVDTGGSGLYQPAVESDGSHAQTIVIPDDGSGYPEYHLTAIGDGPVSVWETDPDGSKHDFRFDVHTGDLALLSHPNGDWQLGIDRGGDGTTDQTLTAGVIDLSLSADAGTGPGGTGGFSEGGSIGLDASALSPDGDTQLDYRWEILNDDGDDSLADEGVLVANGPHATFTPADGPRTIRIRVTVTNHRGQTASAIKTVDVPNAPPVVDAGPGATAPWGVAVTLRGTVTDPSAADRAAGLHPHWRFGDGAESDGATATHVYAEPGTYTATLTATDKDGASASDTTTVTVTPRGATVTWTGSTSATYGFAILSAKVADTVAPATARLAGLAVMVSVDGTALSGTTAADGSVVVQAPLPLAPGTHRVTVTLAASRLYGAASTQARLTVVDSADGKAAGEVTTLAGASLELTLIAWRGIPKGELDWRGSDGKRVKADDFTAIGFSPHGNSLWAAGRTKAGDAFVLHVVEKDPTVELWINGVRQPGSGTVERGHLDVDLH